MKLSTKILCSVTGALALTGAPALAENTTTTTTESRTTETTSEAATDTSATEATTGTTGTTGTGAADTSATSTAPLDTQSTVGAAGTEEVAKDKESGDTQATTGTAGEKAKDAKDKDASETQATAGAAGEEADDESLVMLTESVRFASNDAVIPQEGATRLRAMAREAAGRGEVKEIYVAVWPDQELQSEQAAQSLPETARQLVERRIEALRALLERDIGLTGLTFVNLAERNNALARFMHEDREDVSKEDMSRDDKKHKKVAKAAKDAGGASMAVVIAKIEGRGQQDVGAAGEREGETKVIDKDKKDAKQDQGSMEQGESQDN